jgi:hypothetical protein
MQPAEVLTWFDRFKRIHLERCGVNNLQVSDEQDEDVTTIVLRCPACGNAVRGSVADGDWWQVVQLLDPKKTGN